MLLRTVVTHWNSNAEKIEQFMLERGLAQNVQRTAISIVGDATLIDDSDVFSYIEQVAVMRRCLDCVAHVIPE